MPPPPLSQVEMERTLARTEARLHDKEVECESLAVQLTKAEKEGEELRKRWVCRGGAPS